MGSVEVTTHRHRHRLITTFVTMKSHSVISLGMIIGQTNNVMLNVPAHPNSKLKRGVTNGLFAIEGVFRVV